MHHHGTNHQPAEPEPFSDSLPDQPEATGPGGGYVDDGPELASNSFPVELDPVMEELVAADAADAPPLADHIATALAGRLDRHPSPGAEESSI